MFEKRINSLKNLITESKKERVRAIDFSSTKLGNKQEVSPHVPKAKNVLHIARKSRGQEQELLHPP